MNDMPRPDLFETMDVRRAVAHKPWWRRRLTWALAGAIALTVLAVWAWRLSTPGVAQVAPFGPATWIALVVLLLAVFLVAHFPARRAARAEPAESLHEL